MNTITMPSHHDLVCFYVVHFMAHNTSQNNLVVYICPTLTMSYHTGEVAMKSQNMLWWSVQSWVDHKKLAAESDVCGTDDDRLFQVIRPRDIGHLNPLTPTVAIWVQL